MRSGTNGQVNAPPFLFVQDVINPHLGHVWGFPQRFVVHQPSFMHFECGIVMPLHDLHSDLRWTK